MEKEQVIAMVKRHFAVVRTVDDGTVEDVAQEIAEIIHESGTLLVLAKLTTSAMPSYLKLVAEFKSLGQEATNGFAVGFMLPTGFKIVHGLNKPNGIRVSGRHK